MGTPAGWSAGCAYGAVSGFGVVEEHLETEGYCVKPKCACGRLEDFFSAIG